jgi:hypothetical protein
MRVPVRLCVGSDRRSNVIVIATGRMTLPSTRTDIARDEIVLLSKSPAAIELLAPELRVGAWLVRNELIVGRNADAEHGRDLSILSGDLGRSRAHEVHRSSRSLSQGGVLSDVPSGRGGSTIGIWGRPGRRPGLVGACVL